MFLAGLLHIRKVSAPKRLKEHQWNLADQEIFVDLADRRTLYFPSSSATATSAARPRKAQAATIHLPPPRGFLRKKSSVKTKGDPKSQPEGARRTVQEIGSVSARCGNRWR
jgi:hypothetical protein